MIEALSERRAALWKEFIEGSRFARCVLEEDFDARLIAIYLVETYHYVVHNPRHQALVATRDVDIHPNYRKFCLAHADEETGHELMALNDARSLGVFGKCLALPAALHSTEMLNAYLYFISLNGNPLRRLGYSFWAEDSYQHFKPLLERTVRHLGLVSSQLTFLIAHSNIDQEHSRDVVETLSLYCRTPEDWAAVQQVMEGSLRLQFAMLEEIHDSYREMVRGERNRYSALLPH